VSGGTQFTVDIENSQSVTLHGFTINGGAGGVVCGGTSVCYLTGNTIQSALYNGVLVSAASSAVLTTPSVANGVLYVRGWDDNLYALEASSARSFGSIRRAATSTLLRWCLMESFTLDRMMERFTLFICQISESTIGNL